MSKLLSFEHLQSEQAKENSQEIIKNHMQAFAYEHAKEPTVKQLEQSTHAPGVELNKSVMAQMQEQSGVVRELFQRQLFPLAESTQQMVIRNADKLDVVSLADDAKRTRLLADKTAPSATKDNINRDADALASAAASPFIERARLGAMQLQQGREDNAERTFTDALTKGVPEESLSSAGVRKLHKAIADQVEELKVKRTLPEVFKANVVWIDSSKDGSVDVNELKNAGATKNVSAATMIQYLLTNYDNIDQGVKGIDAEDIRRHWQKARETQDSWF
jgi:hypothetical protein